MTKQEWYKGPGKMGTEFPQFWVQFVGPWTHQAPRPLHHPDSSSCFGQRYFLSNIRQSCKGLLTRPYIYISLSLSLFPSLSLFSGCTVDGRIWLPTFSTLGAFAGCKPPSDKADLEVPLWRFPGSTSISKPKSKQKQAGEQSDSKFRCSNITFLLYWGTMGYLLSQLFMLCPFTLEG